jgi:MoaA/NifB/PqqE/SkfB family radical SAM enzyme
VQGNSVDEYRAPLFIAWQLTNRCAARCITCCEESGPDKAWSDELTRNEALRLARSIITFGIPYVAFGGGEPLGVPHCWEIFELLSDAGVALKLESDGRHIDDAAAHRLAALAVQCVQISVDGATAATHERVRPGSSFTAATVAIERLAARGHAPQLVFVPNRFNVHETVAAYELAVALGCDAFVTGPMMRIGRAAADWARIACSNADWQRQVQALQERARSLDTKTKLSIYPFETPGARKKFANSSLPAGPTPPYLGMRTRRGRWTRFGNHVDDRQRHDQEPRHQRCPQGVPIASATLVGLSFTRWPNSQNDPQVVTAVDACIRTVLDRRSRLRHCGALP